MTKTPRHPKKHWRSLYVWHRVIGVSVAFFALLLAVTGVLINHAGTLDLDARSVRSAALLGWYGISPPAPVCHAAGARWACSLGDDRLALDGRMIEGQRGRLKGVLSLGPVLTLALADGLLLMDGEGRVIERLGAAQGLPGEVRAIGLAAGNAPALRAADGLWIGDAGGLAWRRVPDARAVQWSQAAAPPATLALELDALASEGLLTWERVLLDLHAGRLFGRLGPWLVDAVAIALVALALSGIALWVKQRLRRSARGR